MPPGLHVIQPLIECEMVTRVHFKLYWHFARVQSLYQLTSTHDHRSTEEVMKITSDKNGLVVLQTQNTKTAALLNKLICLVMHCGFQLKVVILLKRRLWKVINPDEKGIIQAWHNLNISQLRLISTIKTK